MTFSEMVAHNAKCYNNGEPPTTDMQWRDVWCRAFQEFNNSDYPMWWWQPRVFNAHSWLRPSPTR
jgi:hypothetical protein